MSIEMYGVQINPKTIDADKLENFLKKLADDGYERPYYEDFQKQKEYYTSIDDDGYSIFDWLDDFEDDLCNYGISALLRVIIEDIEEICISSEMEYLGLKSDAPWCFNEKTRNMSCEEFNTILAKYCSQILNEPVEIRWHEVFED